MHVENEDEVYSKSNWGGCANGQQRHSALQPPATDDSILAAYARIK